MCACTTRCSCGVQPTPEYALVERARRKGRPEKGVERFALSASTVVLQKTYRWAKVRAREGGLVVATPRRQSPHILLYCSSEAGSRGIQEAGYVLSSRLAQAPCSLAPDLSLLTYYLPSSEGRTQKPSTRQAESTDFWLARRQYPRRCAVPIGSRFPAGSPGEQKSISTAQAARWAHWPCRHFKIQSC